MKVVLSCLNQVFCSQVTCQKITNCVRQIYLYLSVVGHLTFWQQHYGSKQSFCPDKLVEIFPSNSTVNSVFLYFHFLPRYIYCQNDRQIVNCKEKIVMFIFGCQWQGVYCQFCIIVLMIAHKNEVMRADLTIYSSSIQAISWDLKFLLI